MESKNYKILLIEELAAAGVKDAMLETARYYIGQKDNDIPAEKTVLVLKYLHGLAGDSGYADSKHAMLLLGVMYYTGRGVEQSYKEAVKWYEKAADKLDSYGLCNLGYCYYYGRDIEIDYGRAYLCFSHSAFLGNPNAMYKLGDMFYHGYHVGEEKNAAFYWYNEAYEAVEYGEHTEKPCIEYRLGRCFLYGYGTEQNLITALGLLQSAELGFYKLIEKGDSFAGLTLPEVKKELDTVRTMLS